jgi:hypothetical protein
MTEELTPKEVALKLLLQDVDPTQIADMLFKLGYSIGWTGWKRDADARVHQALVDAGMPAPTQDAIEHVHRQVIRRVRYELPFHTKDAIAAAVKDYEATLSLRARGDIRNYVDGVYQPHRGNIRRRT